MSGVSATISHANARPVQMLSASTASRRLCIELPSVVDAEQQRRVGRLAPGRGPALPVNVKLGGGAEPLEQGQPQAGLRAHDQHVAVLQVPEGFVVVENPGARAPRGIGGLQSPAERRVALVRSRKAIDRDVIEAGANREARAGGVDELDAVAKAGCGAPVDVFGAVVLERAAGIAEAPLVEETVVIGAPAPCRGRAGRGLVAAVDPGRERVAVLLGARGELAVAVNPLVLRVAAGIGRRQRDAPFIGGAEAALPGLGIQKGDVA